MDRSFDSGLQLAHDFEVIGSDVLEPTAILDGFRESPGSDRPTPSDTDGSSGLAPENGATDHPGEESETRRSRCFDLPGYEILGELGRGGMGVVYKARDVRLNRIVAIKMVLAGNHANPETAARFLAEAATFAKLHHPNIVQIYRIGDCDGRPYFELEHVDGGSLGAQLCGESWNPREAAELIATLADAIHESHRQGIVHRDLKPANILLTTSGVPKVSDFGLAKSLDREISLTRTESILGSPSYMAPEQACGNAKLVGPAADVYSLGAILYELLTGRQPFRGSGVLDTLDQVKNCEPVALRKIVPELPKDLETICLRCLRKEASRRYESAEALADDLRRFLRHELILSRPTQAWERVWKWMRRRPAISALGLISILAISAVVVVVVWHKTRVYRERERAAQQTVQLRGQVSLHLNRAHDAYRQEAWDEARARASNAMVLILSDLKLGDMRPAVADLLERCGLRIAEVTARKGAQNRLEKFRVLHDEMVFYQSQYTGLELEQNIEAARNAANRAFELFPSNRGGPTTVVIDDPNLNSDEALELHSKYYEILLMMAEAVSQPIEQESSREQLRAALRILDRAPGVHVPSRVYHLRRSSYLERLGEQAEASRESKLADRAASAQPGTIDDFLEGEWAYRHNDLIRAIGHFNRVLAIAPDHFWAHYLLAICHIKAQRFQEALAALTACQGRRPGFVWIYLLKGYAEGELKEFDLAEADFQKAAALGLGEEAKYVWLVNRGVMRVRRGDNPGAIGDFLEAIALNPENYQAYVNLAQNHLAGQEWDKAAECLDLAILRNPGRAILFQLRGQLAHQRRDDTAASADFRRAIELLPADDPQLAEIHLESGRIAHRARKYADAVASFDRAIALRPDLFAAHRMRGAALMELKRFDEAIRDFDACLVGGKSSASLLEARGLAYAWKGAYAEAILDYSLALKGAPKSVSLLAHRGWAYLFSGAPRLAERDFSEAIRRDPKCGDAFSGRGMALGLLHQKVEATADAIKSVALMPNDSRTAYNAARIHCQIAAEFQANLTQLNDRDYRHMKSSLKYGVESMRKAIEMLPELERSQFWCDVIRPDPSLTPIRNLPEFRSLDANLGAARSRSSLTDHVAGAVRQ